MATVYVVYSPPDGYGAGGYPHAVFSTREDATAYAEEHVVDGEVEEFIIDEERP